MKAMILAAGRGERMRPLTDHTPKPLLAAGGKPLIEYHIDNLVRAGITDVIINYAHLGALIERALGDGSRFGIHIHYSPEVKALETGGGIFRALPFFGTDPFIVINGDVWTDYEISQLCTKSVDLAYLVLVDNPAHNPKGDFNLSGSNVEPCRNTCLTFAGIGMYRREMFDGCRDGAFPLAPLLRKAMISKRVHGEHHRGRWFDIGTPARLEELDELLQVQTFGGR